MRKKRKAQIDDIWLHTDFGRWALYAAADRHEEAFAIHLELCDRGYDNGVWQLERELGRKLRAELKSLEEWDDYLKALDRENPDLVGFIISEELFEEILMTMRDD